MVDLKSLNSDINDEVSAILDSNFEIKITDTKIVPHSDDTAITFPNLDQKHQGTKLIKTTVLYVDMRNSTALNLKHRRPTMSKLYSAFVRAVTKCSGIFGGKIRGIIGDRVMIIFDTDNCFVNAVNTAELINSICKYVINKHFINNEVTFGIGIDYGEILATKTGIIRRGSAQQSYRSLVWLGRPANIASKLTDQANKPSEYIIMDTVRINFMNPYGTIRSIDEFPSEFIKQFKYNAQTGMMHHINPEFKSFSVVQQKYVVRESTPPILMSKEVYDGFCTASPKAVEIQNNWFKKIQIEISEYNDEIFGGDVVFTSFTPKS